MHCVFFNLVGAKSRRVPPLVPTSSPSLLRWPLLYKHLAEIQPPQANKHNWDAVLLGKESIISEITIYIITHPQNKCMKGKKKKERYTTYKMEYWCHEEKQTKWWLSHFSTLAPKTFSGTSESGSGIPFPPLLFFPWRQTKTGLSFVFIFTHTIIKHEY